MIKVNPSESKWIQPVKLWRAMSWPVKAGQGQSRFVWRGGWSDGAMVRCRTGRHGHGWARTGVALAPREVGYRVDRGRIQVNPSESKWRGPAPFRATELPRGRCVPNGPMPDGRDMGNEGAGGAAGATEAIKAGKA